MIVSRLTIFSGLALVLLSGCTEAQNKLLCGKVLGMEVNRKQDGFFKTHGEYSSSLFQLRVDPPEECRDDWKYDLVLAADKHHYKFYSSRNAKPLKYVTDEKGIIDELP